MNDKRVGTVGSACLNIHGHVTVRLEADAAFWKDADCGKSRPPYLEWVLAEIIGIEDGHLSVMLLDAPIVRHHGYKQGDILTVQFEQLGPVQSAIWLVPRTTRPKTE